MIAAWSAAGQRIADFWACTPREFAAVMRGEASHARAARGRAIISGWIGALEARQEKMHDLDEVLDWFDPKPPPPPQTVAEAIGAMRCWVIATGGELAPPVETPTGEDL